VPVVDAAPRAVELRGAYNFRDLGKLPTSDGGVTRSGVMFRSDALHHLERGDVDRLTQLGVQTIVDLRSEAEVDTPGRGLLADEAIGWYHMPIGNVGAHDYTPSPALAAGDLGAHYVDSLPERSDQLARVIRHLATPASLPAVFHCTAGKDRTGMVAALVLGIVGVQPAAIVADYVLTDAAMPRVMDRLRGPDQPSSAADADADADAEVEVELPAIMRAEARSMQTFLAGLDRDHGGAAGWARASGIDDDSLARLRTLLVDERAAR
jgi:hypothetical protein